LHFVHPLHKFTFKHLSWHSITKILRIGPKAHFPFTKVLSRLYIVCGSSSWLRMNRSSSPSSVSRLVILVTSSPSCAIFSTSQIALALLSPCTLLYFSRHKETRSIVVAWESKCRIWVTSSESYASSPTDGTCAPNSTMSQMLAWSEVR
jgi:hypothetical protein